MFILEYRKRPNMSSEPEAVDDRPVAMGDVMEYRNYLNINPEPVDDRPVATGDVMAAIDEIDGRPHLVIADAARDDAWLSTTESNAVTLPDWR